METREAREAARVALREEPKAVAKREGDLNIKARARAAQDRAVVRLPAERGPHARTGEVSLPECTVARDRPRAPPIVRGRKLLAPTAQAASNRQRSPGSGKQSATAGAATSNRKGSQASRQPKAAAGVAAQNRDASQASGAQGAAAGAAVSNRNQPHASGAQGAAAGAAAVNRNAPDASGAQGAAAGAAVAKRNQPQYSGARVQPLEPRQPIATSPSSRVPTAPRPVMQPSEVP